MNQDVKEFNLKNELTLGQKIEIIKTYFIDDNINPQTFITFD